MSIGLDEGGGSAPDAKAARSLQLQQKSLYVILPILLLFAVLFVGIVLLREVRSFTTNAQQPLQVELHYPAPTDEFLYTRFGLSEPIKSGLHDVWKLVRNADDAANASDTPYIQIRTDASNNVLDVSIVTQVEDAPDLMLPGEELFVIDNAGTNKLSFHVNQRTSNTTTDGIILQRYSASDLDTVLAGAGASLSNLRAAYGNSPIIYSDTYANTGGDIDNPEQLAGADTQRWLFSDFDEIVYSITWTGAGSSQEYTASEYLPVDFRSAYVSWGLASRNEWARFLREGYGASQFALSKSTASITGVYGSITVTIHGMRR